MIYRDYCIEKYREQKKELIKKNELWRICIETEEQFIEELDNIFIETLMFDFINEYHRKNTIKGKINILLQTKSTYNEVIENQKKIEKEKGLSDKEYIPYIKEQLKILKTPLEWDDIVHIYKWIWRNQIKFDDLNYEIQKEFKKTKQYERLKIENKL